MTDMHYDWTFDSPDGGRQVDVLADTQGATAAIHSLLSDSTEDPPAIPEPADCLVTLPVGLVRDDVILTEAEVRELTGSDEEALARVRANPLRLLETLLELGTVRIGDVPATSDVLPQLLLGDRDALVIAIRRVTFGDEMEFDEINCPNCGEYFSATISLGAIQSQTAPIGRLTVPLRKGGCAIVRYPTGADQAAMLANAKATNAEHNSTLLSRCLVEIRDAEGKVTPGGADVVASLGMGDIRTILKQLAATQPGPRLLETTIEHEECGGEVPLPLSVADIFRDF
ncbi:hypothetical protein [Streptomyces sp. CB03238]|uniref:T4 family baseplate hub assembly chaperone n=1 Tax=Streptomyces sp. CB03238 TaxID=1907777 RepID=UPI000A0F8021|nr:hypothetical protein [Streptomyces sp. CB03238]ORT58171.1 hypothetical protein BKD26_19915 [Streptomyces sp. CB03238]